MRRKKQNSRYLIVLALGVLCLALFSGLIPNVSLGSLHLKPYYVEVDSVNNASFKTISIIPAPDTKGISIEFTVINNQENSEELAISHTGVVLRDGTQINRISSFATDSSYSDLIFEGRFVLMPHGKKSFKLGFEDFDYSQDPQFVISFTDGEEFIIPLQKKVNN